jgi:hypothetical protein
MSIALKYTTLKDAVVPLAHFRAEKKRSASHLWRGHGKTVAITSVVVAAVALPLLFAYLLVGPAGYQPWSSVATETAKENAFISQYASTPIAASAPQDYLTSQ